jgi:hypothetical protein
MTLNQSYHLAHRALDGGFTVDANGEPITEGYAVSTRKDAELVISDTTWVPAIAETIRKYADLHRADLTNGFQLGAWRDGPLIVLDLVQLWRNEKWARLVARNAHQLAIFDLNHHREIRV